MQLHWLAKHVTFNSCSPTGELVYAKCELNILQAMCAFRRDGDARWNY